MKLTIEQLNQMPAKTKKDPEAVALYLEHDFIDAYAMHTDRRVERTGYKSAVGADENNWNSHGELQRDFLIAAGLRPAHRLLEIGCGTGRLARKVVPYLDPGNYVGVDISNGAINALTELAHAEGWAEREPVVYWRRIEEALQPVDYVWAFSVMIHLPPVEIVDAMRQAAGLMRENGRFYWSYVPERRNYRSGVKQFRATIETYRDCAACAGLTFEEVPDWMRLAGHEPGRWSGGQRLAVSRLTQACGLSGE